MPVFPLSWRMRGLTCPSHLCRAPKVKAKQRPASVPAQGYVCPLGAEDSFEQPGKVCGWSRGSGGGLLIPPTPVSPALPNTGRNWQRPQIQFCASNPVPCLIGREGPRPPPCPPRPRGTSPEVRKGFGDNSEPSSRLPANSPFPHQALWPLLCQPQLLGLPRELQLLGPKPSAPGGDTVPSTHVAGSRPRTLNP